MVFQSPVEIVIAFQALIPWLMNFLSCSQVRDQVEVNNFNQELCEKFYEADSLSALLERVPAFAIIEYLKEAEFFHLIWAQDYKALIMNVKTHKLENSFSHITKDDERILQKKKKKKVFDS